MLDDRCLRAIEKNKKEKINMFTVGVVMLSYLAGKALICRFSFCESVPFLAFSA